MLYAFGISDGTVLCSISPDQACADTTGTTPRIDSSWAVQNHTVHLNFGWAQSIPSCRVAVVRLPHSPRSPVAWSFPSPRRLTAALGCSSK